MSDRPTAPNGVPYEFVAAEFARLSLANGVPVQAVAGAMAGTALDLCVRHVGIEGARLWISDIAALLVNYEGHLQ